MKVIKHLKADPLFQGSENFQLGTSLALEETSSPNLFLALHLK